MRALIQRIRNCTVSVDGSVVSSVGPGLLVFLGIRNGDTAVEAVSLAERCATLRILGDDAGKMNLSVIDTGGEVMVVSQFTLYADTQKGHRPGFAGAAPPETAEPLYEEFVHALRVHLGERRVSTGRFRAMMDVQLVNDGPVTILLESKT